MLDRYNGLGFKHAGPNLYMIVKNQQVLGQVRIGTTYEHLLVAAPKFYNQTAIMVSACRSMQDHAERLAIAYKHDAELQKAFEHFATFCKTLKASGLEAMREAEVGKEKATEEKY